MDAARSYWPIGHDDLGSYYKIEKAARHLDYRLLSVTASNDLRRYVNPERLAPGHCHFEASASLYVTKVSVDARGKGAGSIEMYHHNGISTGS